VTLDLLLTSYLTWAFMGGSRRFDQSIFLNSSSFEALRAIYMLVSSLVSVCSKYISLRKVSSLIHPCVCQNPQGYNEVAVIFFFQIEMNFCVTIHCYEDLVLVERIWLRPNLSNKVFLIFSICRFTAVDSDHPRH
jgi:hypothetical protein